MDLDEFASLRIKVKDYDAIGSDDRLGEITISMDDIRKHTHESEDGELDGKLGPAPLAPAPQPASQQATQLPAGSLLHHLCCHRPRRCRRYGTPPRRVSLRPQATGM